MFWGFEIGGNRLEFLSVMTNPGLLVSIQNFGRVIKVFSYTYSTHINKCGSHNNSQ